MGDTGPCGPCSEIFYRPRRAHPRRPARHPRRGRRPVHRDLEPRLHAVRADRAGRAASPCRSPRSTPAWASSASPRSCRARTTTTTPTCSATLIGAVETLTGVAADGPQKASHRVIADHLRASSFLVADGVLPSNEGRGYVLRRIMRRAMRHAQLLGAKEPLMWRLVPALVREMGQAYPELIRAEPLITETLKLEETRFRKTLERGLSILDEETRELSAGQKLSGETAFTLYDTYRLPARSHPGCAPSARHRGRHGRLQGRDGAPAREGPRRLGRLRRGRDRAALVRPQGARRRDRVPRLRHRDRRGRRARARQGRRRGRASSRPARAASSSSTRRRSTANPAARSATPAP